MQPNDPSMADLLAQAQAMQTQMMNAQAEIAATTVTGESGNGLVKVTATGSGEVKSIDISPEVVDPSDVETLQDLVVGALADLASNTQQLQSAKMGPIAGGLDGLPGF